MSKPQPNTRLIGRSAITGKFKSIKAAQRDYRTSEVEHVRIGKRQK